jgi:hypothetical protein
MVDSGPERLVLACIVHYLWADCLICTCDHCSCVLEECEKPNLKANEDKGREEKQINDEHNVKVFNYEGVEC